MLLLVLFVLPCIAIENTTLELVSILFRHGERSPSSTYLNDPYKHYKWPGGWNQLTLRGKKQEYELGLKLRKKYNEYLTDYYLPDEVYVLSSYAERCHMSAQLLLAGLYPPQKEQLWSTDILWQPVPIHDNPRNLDNLIAMRKPCPTYDKAYEELYKSEKLKAIDRRNAELYDYLTKHTGTNISSVLKVEWLYNTLQIEELNNLTLPEWTKDVYPEKLKPIAALAVALFTDTDLMKRLKGGPFLQKVINDMEEKQNNMNNKRKLFLYSGHDVTIIHVLRTLGVDGFLKPSFSASLTFELYRNNSTGIYSVKVIYKDDLNDMEKEVKIRDCESLCSLEEFKKVLQTVLPNDWESECKLVV